MDIKLVAGSSLFVAMLLSLNEVTNAVDPYYIPRAKILTRKEAAPSDSNAYTPTPRKCKRLGERAARKSLSCVASINFYGSMINRVHMSRTVHNRNVAELRLMASKISKCSQKYGEYYAKACSKQKTYLNDRRRCHRLLTRRERTECKGEIKRRYARYRHH